jgi:hypothetical protein
VIDGADPFTFAELLWRTEDLTGPERADVFYALPSILQEQAWSRLASCAADRSQRDFEVWCDGS